MYASTSELREEGVAPGDAGDARLTRLLEDATALIDRVTGQFFEPRFFRFQGDGRGSPSLELPVPVLRLDRLNVGEQALSVSPEHLTVVGAPVGPGFTGSWISRRHGALFRRGRGNVEVEGLFGYTEADGTALGRTPLSVRRACLLLVIQNLAPLGDEAGFEARSRWRLIEERTRDQSYRLDAVKSSAPVLTGNPEVDILLLPYVRRALVGAA